MVFQYKYTPVIDRHCSCHHPPHDSVNSLYVCSVHAPAVPWYVYHVTHSHIFVVELHSWFESVQICVESHDWWYVLSTSVKNTALQEQSISYMLNNTPLSKQTWMSIKCHFPLKNMFLAYIDRQTGTFGREHWKSPLFTMLSEYMNMYSKILTCERLQKILY